MEIFNLNETTPSRNSKISFNSDKLSVIAIALEQPALATLLGYWIPGQQVVLGINWNKSKSSSASKHYLEPAKTKEDATKILLKNIKNTEVWKRHLGR